MIPVRELSPAIFRIKKEVTQIRANTKPAGQDTKLITPRDVATPFPPEKLRNGLKM